jgi:hypothetical protein
MKRAQEVQNGRKGLQNIVNDFKRKSQSKQKTKPNLNQSAVGAVQLSA